jgi:hypothetical protein
VLDRKEKKNCDTGNFELAFRDVPLPPTKCVETKFLLEGQRIRRGDLAKYNQIDQKMTKLEKQKERKRIEKELGYTSPTPPPKREEKEEKDTQKDYLAVDLYGKDSGDGTESTENGTEEGTEESTEVSTEDQKSTSTDTEENRSTRGDTDRSQRSNQAKNNKPLTAASSKRGTTSAKLDKIEQILKQSPYNNPKPPTTEKQKKAK